MSPARIAARVRSAWHPAVTLAVLGLAIASAVTGNDRGATLFLFAVALVNAAVILAQHRVTKRGSR